MRVALGTVSLLAAGVVGAVVWLFPSGLLGLENPFRTDSVDRSQPVLLRSIQDISEYHAAVGNFEVVLDHEDDVTWVPGFIAGERSLFVAAGTVDAYVDLSGLADGDLVVSEDGAAAEIRLPDAQLGEPNLDQERTYLFSQERGVVNRLGDALSSQDQQELYQRAEEKLADAAADSELEQQAEENTRTMLTGLLESLDVTVTFVDAD